MSGLVIIHDPVSMNLEGMELNVNGSAEYLIKFTENALLQYSMSSDLEFNVELPDAFFDMEGTGSFSAVLLMPAL